MTEVVIATVLLGSAYLLSNQKNKENFEEQIDKPTINNELKNRMEPTSLKPKIENLNTSIDKYFDKEVLNGNFSHNNMTPFYKNNSYGTTNYTNDNRLDTYTGSGSNHFVKKETATLFKPQDNLQNVFGNQNQNDFLQSRVNESSRHANSKPWEEIREGPGDLGFNSSMQYREQTKPKTVDQLRIANNPKSEYISNYKAPAYKPNQSGQLGKMIKKTPDSYYVNEGTNGMGPAYGNEKPTQNPLQMLTSENRDDTSVLYYGVRGTNSNVYTKGQTEETKKIQLPANPFTNLSSQGIFQTNDLGKDSFNLLDNNRSTKQDYFGAIKGQIMSNVVSPNQLKYTKKSNFIEHPNPVGFMGTNNIKPIVYNPYEKMPTTNREMMSETKSHLNFQGQASTIYINSNPYISNTQRQTTSHSILGNASGVSQYKSYDAEYNQRNIQKPYENRMSNGNMNLYNGNINASINGHEQCNTRTNALYYPSNDTPRGEFTKQTQKYEMPVIDDSLLKAFKENPYTHSLSSVV